MISFAFSGNQKTLSLIFFHNFFFLLRYKHWVSFLKLQNVLLLSWKVNRITVTQTLTTSPFNVSNVSWIICTPLVPPQAHITMSSTSNTLMFRQWGKKPNQTLELWTLVWVQSLSSHVHLERLLGLSEVYFNGLKNKMGTEINIYSTEFTGLLWNSNKVM